MSLRCPVTWIEPAPKFIPIVKGPFKIIWTDSEPAASRTRILHAVLGSQHSKNTHPSTVSFASISLCSTRASNLLFEKSKTSAFLKLKFLTLNNSECLTSRSGSAFQFPGFTSNSIVYPSIENGLFERFVKCTYAIAATGERIGLPETEVTIQNIDRSLTGEMTPPLTTTEKRGCGCGSGPGLLSEERRC